MVTGERPKKPDAKGRERIHPLGKRGERAVCRLLKRKGYRIVARNFRSRHGEIDIVAQNDRHTLFVDNKRKYGAGAVAVTPEKKSRFVSAALYYIRLHPESASCRIDVAEVTYPEKTTIFTAPKIRYFENAFGRDDYDPRYWNRH